MPRIALNLWLIAVCSAYQVGCSSPAESPSHAGESKAKAAPAKVEKAPQEIEIARVTLSPDAERRLGISLAPVVVESVQRRRTFGGELMVPSGKSTIVAAPVSGSIGSPPGGAIPLPGQHVQAGAPILTLAPLLSPERYVPTPAERVQIANARATLVSALTVASGDVERSQAEVDGAQITLDRATKLFEDKAGSRQAVDDAQAQLNISHSNLDAAMERRAQLQTLLDDLDSNPTEAGSAATLTMQAPQSGVLSNLTVTQGQVVNTGTALCVVADVSSLWVRTPIYVDLLPQIEPDANARIVGLDGREDVTSQTATPIDAPPTADPLSTTADLYFEVANDSEELRPGQRVGVELVLRGDSEGLIVPAQAILYDIYGGTWVYVKEAEHAFERRRVSLRYTEGNRTVLAEGPAVGSEVVVDGAAELFGTEFGAGK